MKNKEFLDMLKQAKAYVYLVRQTQPVDYYEEKTIAVFGDKEKAYELARKLNKAYGCGCVFDGNWDLVELDDGENLHYYDVDCQELNPDLNDYTWAIED